LLGAKGKPTATNLFNVVACLQGHGGVRLRVVPKGTDLSLFSQDQLDDIASRLNTRPRKSLGWKAPAELFLPEAAFDFAQHWSAKITPVALEP
jgi:IS30 family transposase